MSITYDATKDLFRRMLKDYHTIIQHTEMNRDQKVGYMVAAMMIDWRYCLGWLDLVTAIQLVSEVFQEEGITT